MKEQTYIKVNRKEYEVTYKKERETAYKGCLKFEKGRYTCTVGFMVYMLGEDWTVTVDVSSDLTKAQRAKITEELNKVFQGA